MRPLYMDDSYLREWDAKVSKIIGSSIILDKTAFYPNGGGQPNDTGKIIRNDDVFDVTNVTKDSENVIHHVSLAESLMVGDAVHCVIDWERRYRLMRMHTAAHIIDAVLYKNAGALCTGNQLGIEKSRIDFSLESINREQLQSFIDEANKIAKSGIDVKTYYLKREDALKIPGVIKLANAMPPSISELRIVEIPGFDIQADGGTQVKNTMEIGEIILLSIENRGKNNRRIYYTLKD